MCCHSNQISSLTAVRYVVTVTIYPLSQCLHLQLLLQVSACYYCHSQLSYMCWHSNHVSVLVEIDFPEINLYVSNLKLLCV